MNYLFYLGIIIPTLITILLFLVFIYCWFLQKARKEVLTKKYDPHGKMRRLGLPMDPPLPPAYCRMDDSLLPEIGEDNVAYDVSRSPSTEQDGRGRPMYQTYHDSGISAGLSPSQESEPRPSLAYRTCPDSGISGFGPQPSQCTGCCQVDEQSHRQAPQQQHVYGDQIQIHAHEQQHRQYHQVSHLPPAVLHHSLIPASVHPPHGVCYGDDLAHSQSPPHYHPASLPLGLNPPADTRNIHVNESPVPTCLANSEHHLHPLTEQMHFHASHTVEQAPNNVFLPPYGRHGSNNRAIPNHTDPLFSQRGVATSSSSNLYSQSNGQVKSPSSCSPLSKGLKHSSYRDSGLCDTGHLHANHAERPDSQASQSSTTDSEDSGFRSSHCAAYHAALLSKQGNPLLKPLRRTKNAKSKSTKLPRTVSCNSDDSTTNGATPLITLNPQNLSARVDNSNVIQNTTLMELELPHRPPRILQANSTTTNVSVPDRTAKSTPNTPHAGPALTFHDGSPIHASSPSLHSPTRENWPPQSSNDQETSVKQNIDLTDISTHLSWKYLQDLSSSTTSGSQNSGVVLQQCHGALRPGQLHTSNPDQHMELFGYSVV